MKGSGGRTVYNVRCLDTVDGTRTLERKENSRSVDMAASRRGTVMNNDGQHGVAQGDEAARTKSNSRPYGLRIIEVDGEAEEVAFVE